VEVLEDIRAGFVRAHRKVSPGHPIDEIPFEHRGVSSNNPAPLVAGNLLRIRQPRHQVVDGLLHIPLYGSHERYARGLPNCRHSSHSPSSPYFRILRAAASRLFDLSGPGKQVCNPEQFSYHNGGERYLFVTKTAFADWEEEARQLARFKKCQLL
jgi:hypothetical protein